MIVLALAATVLLRSLSAAGAPQLSFRLSADSTSFRVDAASYSLSPSCTARVVGYGCLVPLLGADQQVRHSVTACKSSGNVCGGQAFEAQVSCVCPAISPGDCPSGLFVVGTPPTAPTNLSAVAVSSSQIDLTWVENCGADGYIIQRADSPDGPWAEIGRLP